MISLTDVFGKLRGVRISEFAIESAFQELAARFADLPGTVLLLSGGEMDCARHHILGVMPWLTLSGRGEAMEIITPDETFSFDADPFDALRDVINTFGIPKPTDALMGSGLLGYLSYDLKDRLERLPRTSVDDLGLPHLWMAAPSVLVIYDKAEKKGRVCVPEFDGPAQIWVQEAHERFLRICDAPAPPKRLYSGDADGFRSGFTRSRYMKAVEQIREYIAAGHIYQANMSQRFETAFEGDAFSLFRSLYERNPAPFFAYVSAGDHRIVSTSPERFLLLTDGNVETRPIKGTRPRGKTPEEDKRLSEELLASRKDDAELSMIVDLLRNDIGRVCRAGSVRVTAHKRLEPYTNVWHLVSDVVGELDADRDAVDLIRAAFPGGSITGCPKIRAMEIIDELEPVRRHIYTGSIGYISFHGDMDLSIAIRTATVAGNRIVFSVGGGIVFDSDPADEFDETLHKGKTLMEAFAGGAIPVSAPAPKAMAWINGAMTPMDEIAVPAAHPGFQYGYGFFETIRVAGGEIRHLETHMERFNRAWRTLFFREPPDITWPDIIGQVIEANELLKNVAAVKVLAAKGDRGRPPFNDTLLVTARPYVHRLETIDAPGISLMTYPHARQTPLADHKTMNYLYYLMAGEWARKNGGHEALILNPDGTVSETHTANLLMIKDNAVIAPISPHSLPGIMEKTVLQWFALKNWRIFRGPVQPGELFEAESVILTNSLMGAVPVLRIDGMSLRGTACELCGQINEEVR